MVMDNPQQLFDGIDIIMASQSPRRRELMKMTGLKFRIAEPIDVDETYDIGSLGAMNVPEYLSQKKAQAYIALLKPDQILITADTVVVLNGKIMGKPKNKAEAFEMLKSLSDNTHTVITGVTLSDINHTTTFSVKTDVVFGHLSDSEIDYYISKFMPFDKAGGYGIQEYIGAIGIKRIDGSFYNVMGLPVNRLYKELKKFVTH